MLYSYLNERQNFSYAVSGEVYQLKDLEIMNKIGKSGLQCKPRLVAEIFETKQFLCKRENKYCTKASWFTQSILKVPVP
jgi:hypothetical protein